MSDEIQSLMDDLLSPDSIQPKVDILENNISSNLKVSKDEVSAETIILRDGTGAVSEILNSAIKQFIGNFHIPDAIIGDKLLSALQVDPASLKELNKTLHFTVMDHPGTDLTRNVDIDINQTSVKIKITGYPKIDPQNETIVKYYFEHNQYPGKVLPNGKFDYRELHRFPSVKQGDKILFIKDPVNGRPGVTYSGRHLLVTEPKYLDMKIPEGIIREDVKDDSGKPVGYFLNSKSEGVLIINKTDDIISEISVSNVIKLDKIDFTTGNIGSEFKSPVSIEVGEISTEFKVNVDGRIKVGHLNGGIISTNQNANVENIRSNSEVTAQNNIKAKNVADSSLESKSGTIIIESEVRDSKLTAPSIHFTCRKGLMLNNTITTEECIFTGGYYCGTNSIILGKDLFKKIDNITVQIEALESTDKQLATAIEEIKAKLLPLLKDLSTQITDNNVMNLFKLLIRCFQSLEFNFAYKALANLRQSLNVMQIDSIRKSFEELQKLTTQKIEVEDQIAAMQKEIDDLDYRINNIKFQIAGEINPTATIKIFCGKQFNPDEPTLEIKTSNKDRNEVIKLEGHYTREEGLIVK